MRHDCRFFASRAYSGGETVQACELGLAPEAPWRCPVDCPTFERRTVSDAGWATDVRPGSGPVEPPGLDEHADDIASLLGEVEAIVDAEAEVARGEAEQAWAKQQRKERRRRFFRRNQGDDPLDDLGI